MARISRASRLLLASTGLLLASTAGSTTAAAARPTGTTTGSRLRSSAASAASAGAAVAAKQAVGTLPPGGVPDVVTFEGGDVSGVRMPGGNLRYWLGVPFAAPTDGVNAWAPPAPRAPWNGTLDGTAWGAGCYSTDHNPNVATNESYDCLNLNVFAPIVPAGTSVPVMVFLYGGAYKEGWNAGPFGIYNGSYMASQRDVVLVSVNYRLGAMGYLVTDSLTGNYGLLDQRAAMQWVQRNIGLVGGDPTRVTLFGESAGAMSVGFHLTSPASAGLFSQAIMESNVAGFNYKNLSEANVYGQTFCSLLNCSTNSVCDTACLRASSPQAVLKAWDDAAGNVIDFILADWDHLLDGFLQFTPVRDGVVVTQEPLEALYSGNWNKMPIMLGTNTNEGETFIYSAVDFALPGFLIDLALDLVFNPTDSATITAQPRYSTTNVTDGRIPLSNVLTDYWFRCASMQFVAAAVAAGQPAYAYRFNHIFSGASVFPTFGLPAICEEAVCHASELPFVFHNDVPSLNATFTPAEATFSAAMTDYWTSFAWHANPNTNSTQGFNWPQWDPVNQTNIVLNISMSLESSSSMCSMWNKIGYFW